MRLVMRAIEALIRARAVGSDPATLPDEIKAALAKTLTPAEVDEALGIPLIEAIGSLTLLDVIYLCLVRKEVDGESNSSGTGA